jgi:biotin carboxyl carrier protein
MESMKMENNILAERNGTIVKVCAPAGSAVLQDADLFLVQ